jgi:hypothetical protein
MYRVLFRPKVSPIKQTRVSLNPIIAFEKDTSTSPLLGFAQHDLAVAGILEQ